MYSLDYIDEGLYVGDKFSAGKFDLLKSTGITHVLIVGASLEAKFPLYFRYKTVNVLDGTQENIQKYFSECNDFIENAINHEHGKVLVHCFQGISRSCTVVTAYLIYKKRISTDNALRYVKDHHSNSKPNEGFIKQLHSYEKRIKNPDKSCCIVF